ncbi:MAG: 23S rRNA (uracil(1939)-C(5))-methyltransferase RlmD [Planctomycetota bacterium]
MRIELARPETRAAVDCPHFGRCGGCSLLDRSYDDELRGKLAAFTAQVRCQPRLARAEILPVLGAARPLYYRNSLKAAFGRASPARGPRGPRGEHAPAPSPVCGFFRVGSHEIVDVQVCAIQHPLLTELLVATRRYAAELRVPIYDEARGTGLLRHLLARVAPGTGQALVGLVTARTGQTAIARLARALYAEFAPRGLVGVVENLNDRQTRAVAGTRTRPLCGTPFLHEEQDGLTLRSSITSFAQANSEQASVLYAEVLRLVGDVTGRHVADLYAGSGPIALRLARVGARVSAIERHSAAARDGLAAARHNGLSERLRYFVGPADEGLAELCSDSGSESLHALVVDPPRSGLDPRLLAQLAALRVPRIVYVSCDPDSLVRDLVDLSESFDTQLLRPVDLFPRTSHLEVVALLQRRTVRRA